MCPERTESRWIGCLTEAIWTTKIQIKYVDTKNQLPDMLTKGTLTRDDWNHLLRLFNVLDLSMFSCSHFRPIENHPKPCRRGLMHERKPGEELVVAKSKPTLSLVSRSVNRSPMLDSGVPYSTEKYGMQSRTSDPSGIEKLIARDVKEMNEDAASSSQVWHQK